MTQLTHPASIKFTTLLAVLCLLTPAAIADNHQAITPSEPSGVWLDSEENWNQTQNSIPQAPEQDGDNFSYCQDTIRPAVLPEDQMVKAAGWQLTGAAQVYGATTMVMGMANADGMCRPLDYQVFIFTDGEFSGTLSPIPMDSRTDGSIADVDLYREGFIGASFNRYTPEDALCCASGQSRLYFEVKTQGDRAVVVPNLPADTFTPAS